MLTMQWKRRSTQGSEKGNRHLISINCNGGKFRCLRLSEAETDGRDEVYDATTGRAIIGAGMSEQFIIDIGLKRASAPSHLMFTVVMDLVDDLAILVYHKDWLQEAEDGWKKSSFNSMDWGWACRRTGNRSHERWLQIFCSGASSLWILLNCEDNGNVEKVVAVRYICMPTCRPICIITCSWKVCLKTICRCWWAWYKDYDCCHFVKIK